MATGLNFKLIVLSFFFMSCTSGHCRKQTEVPGPTPAQTEIQQGNPSAEPESSRAKVFVYKYDGSMQCNMGDPVDVEQMANELEGIQIFSSSKKSDGLMHIQVCGSPTGNANVYEILQEDKDKALERGFKIWTF